MMTVIVQVPEQTADANSRQKMIMSATLLLREQGFTGTSFGDVLANSGAPRGSIYHHFPGGKNEMVQEAVNFAGGYTDHQLKKAADRLPPDQLVTGFIAVVKKTMAGHDFRAGCPIAAVAVEAHDKAPQLEKAASDVFASWTKTISYALRDAGVDAGRSDRLATLTVTSVEGAIMVCRSSKNTKALDAVSVELAGLYRDALDEA